MLGFQVGGMLGEGAHDFLVKLQALVGGAHASNIHHIIRYPANMYPLNREAQLFTTETTDTISDAHMREIVNCIDGRMNNTYQNAEQVVRTLNVYGIPAVQYVGWVFMSDSAPMYQSFALVKGDHGGPAIIDLSVDPIWPQWEQEMAQYTTPDEMRAAFIEKQSKRWDVPKSGPR